MQYEILLSHMNCTQLAENIKIALWTILYNNKHCLIIRIINTLESAFNVFTLRLYQREYQPHTHMVHLGPQSPCRLSKVFLVHWFQDQKSRLYCLENNDLLYPDWYEESFVLQKSCKIKVGNNNTDSIIINTETADILSLTIHPCVRMKIKVWKDHNSKKKFKKLYTYSPHCYVYHRCSC